MKNSMPMASSPWITAAQACSGKLIAPGGGALFRLHRLHLLVVAPENLGHVPFLESRVGVDLGPVVDLVLQHHHQHPPAAQVAVGVYHGHPPVEPFGGSVLDAAAELGRRGLQRGQPTGLAGGYGGFPVVGPAFIPVRLGEVNPGLGNVAHYLRDAPRLFPFSGGRGPVSGLRRQGLHVAQGCGGGLTRSSAKKAWGSVIISPSHGLKAAAGRRGNGAGAEST